METNRTVTLPIEYVEHLVLCGDTLVVPDTNRLFGVDARTGQLRWQLPNPRHRLYEYLGIDHRYYNGLHASEFVDPAGLKELGTEKIPPR